MIRRTLALACLLSLVSFAAARAAGIAPPPGLVAMWEGRDGASVRAQLRRYAAEGEQPGASAAKRLEAGEAAYWLGVQDARAGRADSALAQWRRALVLRGDFDEGFAVIDALLRRGKPADLAEARALAVSFAEQARLSVPRRVLDAQARLAWALHAVGRPDSAWAALGEWADVIARRPLWARRFVRLAVDAGHADRAWVPAALLAARTRGRDADAESLLVRTQHAAHYTDEHYRLTLTPFRTWVTDAERTFATSLAGSIETFTAPDGFPVQVYLFPADAGTTRLPALFYVPAVGDTVNAADALIAAFTAAGRPVAMMAPRGALGSVGRGAHGPDAWPGHEPELEARVAGDAGMVLDALTKRGFTTGRAWVVGAAGERATTALALARSRRNVSALLLTAPKLPVVEVAEYRAQLRATGTRTFVQVSPEEPDALELGDLLARQTEPGQVRVADSGLAGRGGAIFRGDPMVTQRLLDWLMEKRAGTK